MTHHPLTDAFLELVDNDGLSVHTDELDRVVRGHLAPKQTVVESGVRFASNPDITVEVSATFLRSDAGQLQTIFLGVEPVLLVQPEYDADTNTVTLVLTGCDLDPEALLEVLGSLTDAAEQMVEQQREMGLVSDPETGVAGTL